MYIRTLKIIRRKAIKIAWLEKLKNGFRIKVVPDVDNDAERAIMITETDCSYVH